VTKCPTPLKRKWWKESKARAYVDIAQRVKASIGDRRPKTEVRAYRCGNHWHVTSQAKAC